MAHSAHRGLSMTVFAGVLNDDDARRATEVVEAVHAHGIRCALTGGLAIDRRLREHGRPGKRRSLNDIDFVVEDFASIPESLAGAFFQHHVHPDAKDGRTLLQLVDQPRAIRIDLFCALGASLARASKLTHEIAFRSRRSYQPGSNSVPNTQPQNLPCVFSHLQHRVISLSNLRPSSAR